MYNQNPHLKLLLFQGSASSSGSGGKPAGMAALAATFKSNLSVPTMPTKISAPQNSNYNFFVTFASVSGYYLEKSSLVVSNCHNKLQSWYNLAVHNLCPCQWVRTQESYVDDGFKDCLIGYYK